MGRYNVLERVLSQRGLLSDIQEWKWTIRYSYKDMILYIKERVRRSSIDQLVICNEDRQLEPLILWDCNGLVWDTKIKCLVCILTRNGMQYESAKYFPQKKAEGR